MILNVHNRYSAKQFLQELWLRGLGGSFDFFYLPVDFGTAKCKGYGFINFCDAREAHTFHANFHAKPMFLHNMVDKLVDVSPSKTQGLHRNICWYLKRHSCRVLNPWFQPLLIPNVPGKLIAYPLYDNCMTILSKGKPSINSVGTEASNIIRRLKRSASEVA